MFYKHLLVILLILFVYLLAFIFCVFCLNVFFGFFFFHFRIFFDSYQICFFSVYLNLLHFVIKCAFMNCAHLSTPWHGV